MASALPLIWDVGTAPPQLRCLSDGAAAFFAYFPAMEVVMFETDRLVADCRMAFAQDPTHRAIREVVARAVSDPAAVLKA